MKIKDFLDYDPISLDFKTIVSDSRLVAPGDLFIAIPCDSVTDNSCMALKKGAAAIILESAVLDLIKQDFPSYPFLVVANAREALSKAASYLYPQQPNQIFAVTGTNGKSSVTTFVRQLLNQVGQSAVSFGTVGLEAPDREAILSKVQVPKLTTPDAPSLHKMLHQLTAHGVTAFVFEASSHGLDQYRLHQAKVMSAGFTNLTQDHLDYHGTMEAYFEAKSKLFTEVLEEGGAATINVGCPYGKSLALMLNQMLPQKNQRILTYGVDIPADLVASSSHLESGRIKFKLTVKSVDYGVQEIAMAGIFQVENVLCAMGMMMGMGYPLEEILKGLPSLKSARGRLELVGVKPPVVDGAGAAIYVDYAHTPDALTRALEALRLHLKGHGRLHVVFGCGGNRDALKRPLMGKIANDLADRVIVTDDNPRYEDPSFIRAQILSRCPRGQEIGNRQEAIEQAITDLHPDDILLIAGKGHETGQLIKDDLIPFDDTEVVREILALSRRV
jgi:UDP-N-acetylmuramoyl-L-alanyl-D-glutamate--2,6-diaminopimelate ligase